MEVRWKGKDCSPFQTEPIGWQTEMVNLKCKNGTWRRAWIRTLRIEVSQIRPMLSLENYQVTMRISLLTCICTILLLSVTPHLYPALLEQLQVTLRTNEHGNNPTVAKSLLMCVRSQTLLRRSINIKVNLGHEEVQNVWVSYPTFCEWRYFCCQKDYKVSR